MYLLPSLNSSRSPHGERGLKPVYNGMVYFNIKSLPPRGAWIETRHTDDESHRAAVAPPTGSVD